MKINQLRIVFYLIFAMIICGSVAVAQDDQYAVSIQRFQQARTREFKTEKESPLKKKYLKDFSELSYFDVNPAYRVTAHFAPAADQTPFQMPTFYGARTVKHIKRGTLSFNLNGKDYVLGVYQRAPQTNGQEIITSSYAFVPFRDLTSGSETYQGGRYIDLAKTVPETVTLDFNLAYSPDCAYDNRFICPVTPDENRLETRVEAGEKVYGRALYAKAKK